jgi:hypothetical protein
VNGTSRDRGLAAAIYSAIFGGSILLIAEVMALPTPLLVSGWILLLASVVAAFALAVVISVREGVGLGRAFVRGVGLSVRWIVWFLP